MPLPNEEIIRRVTKQVSPLSIYVCVSEFLILIYMFLKVGVWQGGGLGVEREREGGTVSWFSLQYPWNSYMQVEKLSKELVMFDTRSRFWVRYVNSVSK